MKYTTQSVISGIIGLAAFSAILSAPLVSEARAEAAGPKVSALESRIRDLETRMAKVEARVGEHESSSNAGQAQHTGAGGMPGDMPDNPMGQMPPQHSMPPQSGQPQQPPMGGGMGDM